MPFIGRSTELERIRQRIGGPGPSLLLVSGPRRSGRTTVLRQALDDVETLWYEAAPLPDPDHRKLLSERLAPALDTEALPPEADWPEIFTALAEHLYAMHHRLALVLDDWQRLVEVRSRIVRHLTEFWLEVRRRGLPLHLVLSTTPGPAAAPFRDPEDPLGRWLDEEVSLGPLPFRDVTSLGEDEVRGSDGRSARERLVLYQVFGGWPDVVRHLEPRDSLETNLQRLVLAPDAPLLSWGVDLLARQIQAPGRYASILRALAGGAREWGGIRDRVRDFGSSGQMAPYIQRLEEMGIVSVERSLDASPRSRSRRYRIVDPFTAFWFRFVLPDATDLQLGRGRRVWAERIRPDLHRHLALVFPSICRQWMRLYAEEALPARAREVGGLWGKGYDLDVAGTLATGAVFYGHALWGDETTGDEIADRIGRELERTRYGFGREGRHRFIFGDTPPPEALRRRAARDEQVHVFGPATLVGR